MGGDPPTPLARGGHPCPHPPQLSDCLRLKVPISSLAPWPFEILADTQQMITSKFINCLCLHQIPDEHVSQRIHFLWMLRSFKDFMKTVLR